MYNYEKLMALKPTSFGKITNEIGQEIEFYEHPFEGDRAPVICVCHELKLAEDSTFFETDDMIATHDDYRPSFQARTDGKVVLWIGTMLAKD